MITPTMLSAVKDKHYDDDFDIVYNPIIRNLSMTAVQSGIAKTSAQGQGGRDLRTLIRDLITDPIIREIPPNLRHLIPYHPECWINIFLLISDKKKKKLLCADVIRILLESDFLSHPEMMRLQQEDYLDSFLVGTLYIFRLLDIIMMRENFVNNEEDQLLIVLSINLITAYYYFKIKGDSLSQKKEGIVALANMFDVLPLNTGIQNTLLYLIVGYVLAETTTKKEIAIARTIANKLKKNHPLDFVGEVDRMIEKRAKELSKDKKK